MPPVLTPEQQAIIDSHKTKLERQIQGFNRALAEIDSNTVPSLQAQEDINKAFWDFYNEDTIVKYEEEIEYINGTKVTNPLSEQDIADRSNNEGRLWDIFRIEGGVKRISQFDGLPTTTNPDHEFNKLNQITQIRNYLVQGLPTSKDFNEDTAQSIGVGDSQLVIEPGVQVGSDWDNIAVNDYFIVTDGTNSFIGRVTSKVNPTPGNPTAFCSNSFFTTQSSCENANEDWFPVTPPSGGIINFQRITEIVGTINSGASVKFMWNGFNNLERIDKLSLQYQDVIDQLLVQLSTRLGELLTYQNNQKTALENNLDDNLDPNAIPDTIDDIASFVNYGSTLLIDDLGIAELDSIISDRTVGLNQRVSDANSKKSNLYELRFFWTEQRVSQSGTLKKKEDAIKGKAILIEKRDKAQEDLDLLIDQGL